MVILCMVPHNSCFCLLSLEVEVEHVHNIVESSATTKNKNKQELLQLGTQNVWQQKNMEIDDN